MKTLTRTGARGAAALLLAVALAACGTDDGGDAGEATDTPTDTIQVEDPWVRATEGAEDTTMTAAFMVLDNTGDTDVSLVGASTEVAETTELHEMVMVDGSMMMQETEEGFELAAGKAQLLQPGGLHVMLMGVTEPLAAGDEVDLVLEFSDGSEVAVTAPVKAFTEEEGHYHAPGTGEHTH